MNRNLTKRLFEPRPTQWGLRGDDFLWEALRDKMSNVEDPPSMSHFQHLLSYSFLELVGINLAEQRVVNILSPEAPETIYRSEFAHGGMSSGYVALEVWRDRLIPLLEHRAAVIMFGASDDNSLCNGCGRDLRRASDDPSDACSECSSKTHD